MTHKDDRRPTAIGPLSGSDDLKIHSKEKNNVVLTVHEGNLIIFIFNFRIYFSFDLNYHNVKIMNKQVLPCVGFRSRFIASKIIRM